MAIKIIEFDKAVRVRHPEETPTALLALLLCSFCDQAAFTTLIPQSQQYDVTPGNLKTFPFLQLLEVHETGTATFRNIEPSSEESVSTLDAQNGALIQGLQVTPTELIAGGLILYFAESPKAA